MNRPNIIFIVDDQHRWDFMGYENNGVTHTPNLNRIGRRGTIFRTAYCTAPLCSPSRAAIASGRYGMNTGCFTNLHELPSNTPSFVNQLRTAGYHTCNIGKTHMEIHAYNADYTSAKHHAYMESLGWSETYAISGQGMLRTGIKCEHSEFLRAWGVLNDVVKFCQQWHYFMDKDDFRCTNPAFAIWPLAEEFQETAWVGRRAVQWLRERDRSRPFFLHMGFGAPHPPLEPLSRFMDLYRNTPESEVWATPNPTEHTLDMRRGYRAMISQIDHCVGEIERCLAEDGSLDNTVIVFTSDHGSTAGDHNCFGQTNFYESVARVPLLMAGPSIKPGQDCRAFVELVDLGRTVCDLAAVPAHALDLGKSLVPVLHGQSQTHRETVYAEMGCDRMIRDERYKLMWGDPLSDTRKLGMLHLDKPVNIPPSPARLFDLQEDPRELHNLADDPAHRETRQRMLEKLLVRINLNTQTQPNQNRGEYRPLVVD